MGLRDIYSRRDNPIIDDDDTGSQTAAITPGQKRIVFCSLTTKNGRRARIVGVGQAWDAAIDGQVVWYLLQNGQIHNRFQPSTGQIESPGDTAGDLNYEIPCPPSALLQLAADLPAGASIGGNITGRIRVVYQEF